MLICSQFSSVSRMCEPGISNYPEVLVRCCVISLYFLNLEQFLYRYVSQTKFSPRLSSFQFCLISMETYYQYQYQRMAVRSFLKVASFLKDFKVFKSL